MDNDKILEKAIKKAEDNGFKITQCFQLTYFPSSGYTWKVANQFFVDIAPTDGSHIDMEMDHGRVPRERIIFDHDFAKALWPEPGINHALIKGTAFPFTHDWERHLMEMVISKDPIKYLGKNI